jgi:hypothetical protein
LCFWLLLLRVLLQISRSSCARLVLLLHLILLLCTCITLSSNLLSSFLCLKLLEKSLDFFRCLHGTCFHNNLTFFNLAISWLTFLIYRGCRRLFFYHLIILISRGGCLFNFCRYSCWWWGRSAIFRLHLSFEFEFHLFR